MSVPLRGSVAKSPLWLILCLCTLSSGCKRDSRIPELAPAYGVVTFNGKPLADATVSFVSTVPEKGHLPGIGSTNKSGEFRVRSYNLDGAVVGRHKVVIIRMDESSFFIDPKTSKPVPKMDPRWKLPKTLIPVKYTHPDKSGLTAEVKAGTKNKFKFELVDD